jgi:hypothetical protein
LYLWKQKFGGAGVPELQRLKALALVAIKELLTRKL